MVDVAWNVRTACNVEGKDWTTHMCHHPKTVTNLQRGLWNRGGGVLQLRETMVLPYQPASWKFRTILPMVQSSDVFLLLFFRHESHPETISPSSKHFKYASKCSPLWWKSHCHLGYFSYDWIHHHEWDIWHTYWFAKFACQQFPHHSLNPTFRGFIGYELPIIFPQSGFP